MSRMPGGGRERRGRERRGSERADARLSMRVEAGTSGSARVVTETQNVSSSGVYCYASHYLAPLSRVQITIVIPRLPGAPKTGSPELMKCDGIVVRCDQRQVGERGDKPYELACMFTRLDAGLRGRLEEFVTWRNLQALRDALGRTSDDDAPTAKSRSAARARTAAKASAAAAVPKAGSPKPGAHRVAKPATRASARPAAKAAAKPAAKPTAKPRAARAKASVAPSASRNGSGRNRH